MKKGHGECENIIYYMKTVAHESAVQKWECMCIKHLSLIQTDDFD